MLDNSCFNCEHYAKNKTKCKVKIETKLLFTKDKHVRVPIIAKLHCLKVQTNAQVVE